MDLIALQQPLIMVASMLTGKDVSHIIDLEVHDRAVLLDGVVGSVKDLTAAMCVATDPAGENGVALSENELHAIASEAGDIKTAAVALLDYRSAT